MTTVPVLNYNIMINLFKRKKKIDYNLNLTQPGCVIQILHKSLYKLSLRDINEVEYFIKRSAANNMVKIKSYWLSWIQKNKLTMCEDSIYPFEIYIFKHCEYVKSMCPEYVQNLCQIYENEMIEMLSDILKLCHKTIK